MRKREAKKIKALNDARAELCNMRGPRGGGELEGEAESQPGYLMHLRKVIRDAGGEIPDFPEVSHKELVRRALAGRRPFNDAGRLGYRDTLIWHTVLEIVRDGDTVVLATEDGDFRPADGADRLHDHLIADLRQRGIDPERVSVVHLPGAVAERVILGKLRELMPYVMPYTAFVMRKTSVYLDDEQADRLARLALTEGRPQAEIVREAISCYRPRPNRDRNFALAGNFERIDADSRSISEIPEDELMRGFGE